MHRIWKTFLLSACFLIFASTAARAVPPDLNADRRVHIKCPCTIDKDRKGRFQADGLMNTLRRLYHELDNNLKASERKAEAGKPGAGYTFSDDPNTGIFFVAHAKAFFPEGTLKSLVPKDKIDFQEVFYVTDIDWDSGRVRIARQRDRKAFSIHIPDFERAFIWYNALLDKQRAYIPVYGFLSLPGEADAFPTIWNSWEKHRKDTATPPESLVDYDFYKILDYRDGYYLLAKDFNEFDYRENIYGGTRYLRYLLNHFMGNLQLAVAAYNAGENAVFKYGTIPPFEETQQNVRKVMSFYNVYLFRKFKRIEREKQHALKRRESLKVAQNTVVKKNIKKKKTNVKKKP